MTPINVISNEVFGGATFKPTTMPTIPVTKNIIIKTLSRKGLTYFMDRLFTIRHYYNLM
ncbi:MAG: hypothetical protein KGZ34_04385 [Nitrosarchaeum sp.]|nr:hypothetical protein [Nitrosarchaeum sp.]